MKAKFAIWISVGALLIAVTAMALRYTVFLDAKAYWTELVGKVELVDGQLEVKSGIIEIEQAWFEANAKRFHKGDRPCLRYVGAQSITDERVAELAETIEDSGLLGAFSRQGYFNSLFYKWRIERAEKIHDLNEEQEALLAVKARVGWRHRVLISLNRGKLLAVGREVNRGAVSLLSRARQQQASLTAHQLDQLRGLWNRFGTETTPSGLIKLGRELRPRLTLSRMNAIGKAILQWAARHSSPPETLGELVRAKHLTRYQIIDGWQMQIQLEQWGKRVRLVSLGADHREGGSGQDKDIVREFELAIAPDRATQGTEAKQEATGGAED